MGDGRTRQHRPFVALLRASLTVTLSSGDRVRVIDLDVAGRVVAVIDGDPPLVIVDVHGDVDRLSLRPDSIEHLD